MKTKTDYAHEWYLKHAGGAKSHMDLEVDLAWKYADAMQAEADKREIKGVPESIRNYPEIPEGWQPDWSQAPKDANIWQKSSADNHYWYCGDTCLGIAPSFNYTGNWQDSLRKRP